jgi:hypothetical protein
VELASEDESDAGTGALAEFAACCAEAEEMSKAATAAANTDEDPRMNWVGFIEPDSRLKSQGAISKLRRNPAITVKSRRELGFTHALLP